MFTGIITEIGKVKSKNGNIMAVSAPNTARDLNPGDSVCVNGVCVTVIENTPSIFKANLLGETIGRTNLAKLKIGDAVNLELSLKAGDRIGGHIVTGHVDCVGRLVRNYKKGNDKIIEIEVPYSLVKYVVIKGSVSIDGVSLTVVKKIGNRFTVHLIPYTLKYTTLGNKRVGSLLNVEIDILARYAGGLPLGE